MNTGSRFRVRTLSSSLILLGTYGWTEAPAFAQTVAPVPSTTTSDAGPDTTDAGAPAADGGVANADGGPGDVDAALTPDGGAPESVVPAEQGATVTADAEPATKDLGTIVVTGVRGGRARTVADSPEPIDVIQGEELTASGHAGLKETLGSIVPALTMPAQGGGGTSASVRPYAYRGLSGDYLLILVNGKRRHTTSLINNLSLVSGGSTPVDLDLIPTSAVSRIEILRDGAAAQYGSDAISGVMNIILDRDPDGLSFTQTGGATYHQGAELLQQTVSYGTKLPKDGFIRFTVEGKLHNPSTSSAEPLPAVNAKGQPNTYFPLLPGGVQDPRESNYAGRPFAGGYGRSNRDIVVNGSYNAELPLAKDVSLYSFSTLAYRDIKDARGAFSANNINSLPEIYPTGFQAYRRIWEWDGQATVGTKFRAYAWDWDLSTSFGRDNARLGAENTLNPSIGPSSPTSFRMGRQIQDLWITNLDTSHPFDIGRLDPLVVSLGAEHRWERFQNRAGEPDSYRDGGYVVPAGTAPFNTAFGGQSPSPGLASFTGTSPADARSLDRNNVAGYVDVFTNVTKKWYVGVAGRAEHYDDSAGNTVSGKVSTRYEIVPGLAVRGGVNNGFRAPSLAQTGFSTTQNTVTIIGNERVQTTSKFLPVDSAAAIALGAEPLKPEKSVNVSAGITFEASRAVRLTADAYQVQVNDRIVKTDFIGTANNGGAAIKNLLVANGVTGVDSAQFFSNAIDTRTRGVDIVAEYTLKTADFGTFRPSAAFSYAYTEITHVKENPTPLRALNVVMFGRQGQIDLVSASPKDKLVLTANWAIWRFKNTVRLTRYDEYTEASTTPGFDVVYDPKWITDADVAYDLTDNLSLAVGAYNVFDVYPEKKGPVSAIDGSGAYGIFSPYGLTGGFYYARLAGHF